MSSVDTYLFFNDRLHETYTTSSVTCLNSAHIQNGYSPYNVRQTDMFNAWKPPDQNTSDEKLDINGGSTGWLGAIGETYYICVAYDGRGADQTTLSWRYYPADDGALATTEISFLMDTTRPACGFGSATIRSNAGAPMRRYELCQALGLRGGGTKTAKVFALTAHNASDVYRVRTDFPGETTAPGRLALNFRAGLYEPLGGAIWTNRNGVPSQEFDLVFAPAGVTYWKALRDRLYALDNNKRAFFIQFEGLRNTHAATPNFFMVRVKGVNWTSYRPFQDVYRISVTLQTEAFGF